MAKESCNEPVNIVMPGSDDIVYCIAAIGDGEVKPVCISVGDERRVLMLDSGNVIKGWRIAKANLPGLKLGAVACDKADYEELNNAVNNNDSEGCAAVARPTGENR